MDRLLDNVIYPRRKSFDPENYLCVIITVRYSTLLNIVIAIEIVSRGVCSMCERFVMMFVLGVLFLCSNL